MRALADARAQQLREHSGFPNAGVYDPPSVNGTHVIYVLHDITKPELYGGLPANPTIPPTYTIWKRVAKPIGLVLGLLAAPVAFFHYVTEGPKEPSPPSRDFGGPGTMPPGAGEPVPPSPGSGVPRPGREVPR
jgi:formate dehydrogenase iron-sulfur subunit